MLKVNSTPPFKTALTTALTTALATALVSSSCKSSQNSQPEDSEALRSRRVSANTCRTYVQCMGHPAHRPHYERELGKACVAEILKIDREGKSLRHSWLRQQAKPFALWEDDGKSRKTSGYLPLYHYTKASVAEGVRKGSISLSDFVAYSKRAGNQGGDFFMPGRGPTESSTLYVASDPYSSSGYGHYLVRLEVSRDLLTISADSSAFLRASNNGTRGEKRIYQRLNGKCHREASLVAYEQNGIDLIDYTSGGWYYLLSPNKIRKHRVLHIGETGGAFTTRRIIDKKLKKHRIPHR